MCIHQLIAFILGLKTSLQTNGKKRILFSLAFSTVFVTALYGLSVLKMAAICLVNYMITKSLGRGLLGPIIVWLWCILILFANDAYKGYKYGDVSQHLAWMDNMNGLGLRWYVTFNFTMLRMVSFSMDYQWQFGLSKTEFDKHKLECRNCHDLTNGDMCGRGRLIGAHHVSEYNLVNYFAYLLYAPLFLAGPIICFNDFLTQVILEHLSNYLFYKIFSLFF